MGMRLLLLPTGHLTLNGRLVWRVPFSQGRSIEQALEYLMSARNASIVTAGTEQSIQLLLKGITHQHSKLGRSSSALLRVLAERSQCLRSFLRWQLQCCL